LSRGSAPDRILTDLLLWTGAGGPPGAAASGQALAFRKGRILALGPAGDVEALARSDTEVVRLGGRFVAPGFVDAHVHLLAGGLALSRLDLRGCGSVEEVLARIRERAGELPPDAWVLGGDWSEEDWGGPEPTRDLLDRAAPNRPVFLHRTDLHTAVANSRALELAGVGPDTPEPENGVVERDPETGEPTGVLREHALLLVTRVLPESSEAERRAAVRSALGRALAGGITQVHDMGGIQDVDESWTSLEILRRLRDDGELPLRVYAALPLAHWSRVAAMVRDHGRGDGLLGWGMVKGFVDGSLGSSTAWFQKPYADDPENMGTPISDLDELRNCLASALEHGLQPAVHAIGDRAVDWLFRAREEVGAGAEEVGDLPFRVEHAQHLPPDGVSRSARTGMILSVQPYHLTDDAPRVSEKLGPEREGRALAFRSMLDAGATLAFGSDWPVAPLEPVRTLQAGVTRVPAADRGSEGDRRGEAWTPGERLSIEEALVAHTRGGDRAGLPGARAGILEAGREADLVVLSRNPFQTDPLEWHRELKVEMTFVAGKPVYRSEGG